ncbi:MAG: hypothetical protein JNL32_03830 [Candidatus Kapabacteria bacterium]|nr:hypothetical protein [Candidatus Kapabacteria bacterium]
MKTTHNKGLTKRQSDVMYFLKAFIREKRYAPSIKEICAEFGFASTNAAHEILKALEVKGYISRPGKGTSRSIIIKDGTAERDGGAASASSATRQLTIIGEGMVENPVSVFMQPRGQIAVDAAFFGIAPKQQFFAAIVPDNAMSGSGITEGDVVIIQQAAAPAAGEVILLLMHDRTLLRVADKSGKDYELSATTKGYPKIRFTKNDTSLAVLGVVRGVIRKIR